MLPFYFLFFQSQNILSLAFDRHRLQQEDLQLLWLRVRYVPGDQGQELQRDLRALHQETDLGNRSTMHGVV